METMKTRIRDEEVMWVQSRGIHIKDQTKTGQCLYQSFALGEVLALICSSFGASEPLFENEGYKNIH